VRSLQWRHLPDLGAQYVPRNKLSNYRPRNLCLRQRPPTAGSLTYQNFVLTRNLAAGFDTVCPRRSLMTQVQHWAKAAQTDHVTLRPSKFGHARPLGSRIIRYVRVGRTDGRTDRRTDGQKQRLFPLPYGGGIEISLTASVAQKLPIQKYPLFECTT